MRSASVCACGEHCWVALTRGYVAFADAEAASFISKWKWSPKGAGSVYAARTYHQVIEGRRKTFSVPLHTIVLHAPKGWMVDHRDGDTMNNRSSNLRLATSEQNAINRSQTARTASQFRGVSRAGSRWQARIRVKGELRHLGVFDQEEDAAKAYDAAAVNFHGEFACPNFGVAV